MKEDPAGEEQHSARTDGRSEESPIRHPILDGYARAARTGHPLSTKAARQTTTNRKDSSLPTAFDSKKITHHGGAEA